MLPLHHRVSIITQTLLSSHRLLLHTAAISFSLPLSSSPRPSFSLPLPPPPAAAFLSIQPPRGRRLKLTPMDPPHLSFSSPDSLADWLNSRLPSGCLASWGVSPGTKTLHNLWLEIAQGETTLLSQQTPLRAVHVATVRVRNQRGALLVESHQLLSDGTVRTRGRPLSEKMRPGESIEEAALRAIREELGVVAVEVRIVPESIETRVEERCSASYPGLPARYVLHSVYAEVDGLPEDREFSTEEAGECLEAQEEKAVFVRRHFWKWVDDDDGGIAHPAI